MMETRTLPVSLLVLYLVTSVSSSRILFLSIVSSKSHMNAFSPLTKGLAQRGHEVTLVSGYPPSSTIPNLTEVSPPEAPTYDEKNVPSFFEIREKASGPLAIVGIFKDLMRATCEVMFKNKDLQRLRKEQWDLVVLSLFVNECGLAFAHTTGAPYIYFSPGSMFPWVGDNLGLPGTSSYIPSVLSGFQTPMTFLQRTTNLFLDSAMTVYRKIFLIPIAEKIVREHLGSDIPPLEEIEKNVSLTLLNNKLGMEPPKPLLPDIIQVGGLHCHPAKPLTKHLDTFLEGSGEAGAIYFSLGSVTNGSKMPGRFLPPLLKAFSSLPQKVIWKWESEPMEGVPSNVLLQKWLPQQDLLGDPRVKVFITHGGLLSTMEANYHGVPILGLPLSADQNFNMARVVDDGVGLVMEWETLNANDLIYALKKLMTDKTIRQKVAHRAAVFTDEPMKPLDTAIYWTEYVIRHAGARHLRCAGRDLPWYQYHSIDVIAFLALVVMTIATITILLLKKLLLLCCGRKKSKQD